MSETGNVPHPQTELATPVNPPRLPHEAKTRWVEQIEQDFSAGESAAAQQAVADALREFPDDGELHGLALLAEEAVRRSSEASLLLDRAGASLAGGNAEEALAQLRNADRLDERNGAIRTSLVAALVERARALLASDWRAAEPYVKEALELDRGSAVARSLASLIENYRREGSQPHAQEPAAAEPVLPRQPLPLVAALSGAQESAVEQAGGAEATGGLKPTPQQDAASATVVLSAEAVASLPFSEPEPEQPPPPAPPVKPKSKLPIIGGAIAAAVAIAIAAFFVFHGFPSAAPSTVAVSLTANVPAATFTVDGQPAQAPLRLKLGPHTVAATAAGYVPATQTFTLNANSAQPVNIAFALQPELPQVHISSALKAGKFVLDKGTPIDLTDGAATLNDLPMGDHTLTIFDGNREMISLAFRVQPKEIPSLTAPLSNRATRAVVIASLGNSATVYATPGTKAALGNAPLEPVAASGLALSNLNPANANLTVADRAAKPQVLPIETSAAPAINVILNGAIERIPLTVTANVPDAVVLIDGTPLKAPMANGSRVLALLPGKFRIQVEHKGYTPSAEQSVEIKAGEKPQPLAFTLTPLVQYATLSVSGAPAQTEVWIDAKQAGEIDGSGKFTQKIPAGSHKVSLRKPNFEQVAVTQDFKPDVVVRLNGSAVRPYGTVKLHVTPAGAKITYLREGADQPGSAQANQAIPLPQGTYRITAEADQYISKSATVKVVPGGATSLDWTLKAVAKPQTAATPASLFENGGAWTVKAGWWTHNAMGYSFMRRRQGTFEIDILKQSQKSFLHSRPKRVDFVADYIDEGNRVAYTLDGHNLTRRVFAKGDAQHPVRVPLGADSSPVYRFVVDLASHSVTLKTVSGKTLDSVKTSGPMGKFGFQNEVELVVR